MKVVLATGIYPPEIGGPATHAQALAEEFAKRGNEVVIVTYVAKSEIRNLKSETRWRVVSVSKFGGLVCRWRRYAKALKKHASDADAVIAFSSVSTGVPLWLARLKKPKKILRLGGDFFWERYTDHGGRKTLRGFYTSRSFVFRCSSFVMGWILHQFDHIVFSTKFQEGIYEQQYKNLPSHFVIENASPAISGQRSAIRIPHQPFRLLFMGRFVGFKNLPVLLEAASNLEGVTLTMVGDGPLLQKLEAKSYKLKATFLPPVHGEEKLRMFAEHDLLVLPSLTEISPNIALEARASGLPVLLTEETGLSGNLRQGMVVRDLATPEKIAEALEEAMKNYDSVADEVAKPPPERSWGRVVEEYLELVT